MLIPITVLFLVISIAGLTIGLLNRSAGVLLALNFFWWLVSFPSAYFVYLAWLDRGYSENWGALGFFYFTLPFAVLTILLLLALLYFMGKWEDGPANAPRISSLALLVFLVLQLIIGFISL